MEAALLIAVVLLVIVYGIIGWYLNRCPGDHCNDK